MELTIAFWDYDRVDALIDGRVGIDGVEPRFAIAPPGKLFPLAVGNAPYDVTEMSLSSYLMQVADGTSAYVALPIFLSRCFRHNGIYVRPCAGITDPKHLEGRRVGVPEYQMTAALWIRGILADEYGVKIDTIRYRTGSLEPGVRPERLPLKLPTGIDVEPIAAGTCLDDLLVAGDLDAVLAPKAPPSFKAGHPMIQRLFPDFAAREREYHQRTGFFPIMHPIGIKKELVEEFPWLPKALFDAFKQAKDLALERVRTISRDSANRLSLPWLYSDFETVEQTMGRNPDYWAYGIEKNRAELEWICEQSYAQHLASRRLTVAELFPHSGET